MTKHWLPIRYRDFYDVPRAVVVEFKRELFLFDSLFDADLDEYESFYAVYRLPGELRHEIDGMSWTDLGQRGTRLGSVDVAAVEFDSTRRRAINESVFENLGV
ncbi:MAG: hypothetical protein ACRD0A_06775 [Acidimicrobiales bacterium]